MNRLVKDNILKGITYLASAISVIVLAAILYYLVSNGIALISSDLVTGDYYATTENAAISEDYSYDETKIGTYDGDGYYSQKWGIALEDITTAHNDDEITVAYVDPNSPFMHMNSLVAGENGAALSLTEGSAVQNIYYLNETGETVFLSRVKMGDAKNTIEVLDSEAQGIVSINYESIGGGIRGSIFSTLYLIAISLLISLPIGISSAIYLHEYASKNKINSLIRQGIDTLTGVPSIVYGLMGVTVLFPVTQLVGATSTSILLGGLTLAIMLLPTIIRSTEEALIVVPQSLRDGSLSLGATKSQTIFKVVLPCAVNGILTGVLLGIGRVIGESAALVYTTSTVISDNPTILSQGTSLSLMIWSIMSGEQPNYELASAISLIILVIVFAINFIVKIIGKRLAKSFV